jgi:hypothetical protein
MRARGSTRPVVAVASAAAVALAVRRLSRRSGATDGEARARLPGDELVPDPQWVSTRAITVTAPAEAIWPWIVQMGYPSYRAGWYTPHWLDRFQWGIREGSAERIRPELQHLQVGDRVPDSRDWSVFFTVAALKPGHALVLRSTRHLLKPIREIDFTWAFVLEPDGAGTTRLLIRARVRGAPGCALRALEPLLGVGDYLNASTMLRGIKRRSEGAYRRVQGGRP